jgi:anti-anti-sigma factor
MREAELASFHGERLRLVADTRTSIVEVHAIGTVDGEVCREVAAFFDRLHSELCRTRAPRVLIDLRELRFISSSGIKVLATWIFSIAKLEPRDRYRVTFLTNPNLGWQRPTLEAFQSLAPAIVEIDAGH